MVGEDQPEEVMLEQSFGEAMPMDEREVWSRQELQARRHGGEAYLMWSKPDARQWERMDETVTPRSHRTKVMKQDLPF